MTGYDPFGELIKSIDFSWNYGNSSWDTTNITLPSQLDGFGRPVVLNKMYYYGAGVYDTTGRIEIQYSPVGKRTFSQELSWNGEMSYWDTVQVIRTYYDALNRDTLELTWQFDYYYYMLLPYSKKLSTYDANGNLVLDALLLLVPNRLVWK